MSINENRKWLHQRLQNEGFDIGEYDAFESSLKNKEDADWYYNKALKLGLEIGDRDEFESHFVLDPKPTDKEENEVAAPKVTYPNERASLKEQVANNNQKFPKMQDLPWAKPKGGVDGHVYTTDLSERLNRTYQDGGMESFLHSEEDEKIKTQYTPKEEKTTADVWGNVMNKFALTERGGQFQYELAQIQDEITNKYLEEFKDSDEYKQFLGKKYATKDEEYEANKAVNDLFNAKYAEAISNDMQPYMQAYNNEVMHRYGVDVESGLNNIAKKEAAETLGSLSTSVDADLEKIDDAITSRQKAVRNIDWKPGMPSSRDDAKLAELRGQRTYLEGAKELIEDSQNILNAVEAEKNGSFFGGLGRGIRDKAFDIDTWTMGLSDLVGGLRLKSVLEKAEKGETLTPAEQKLLDASVNNMAVNFYYRNDLGLGYQAGEITGQSIPFMLEFLVNPVSASGNAMAKRLLTYGLKRFGSAVNSKVIKAGARLVTDALAAGGVTATTGMGHVLSGGIERLNKNYEYGLDEEGNLNVVNTHNMGVGEAFAKSAASAYLERQSEMIFNAFRGAPSLFKGIETSLPGGVNTFMNYVRNSRLGELWKGIKNNATMKELAKRTQFHGLGEEYLEEVYNNFANIPLGEMTFEEATDLENNIVTFLGLAPTQVMFSAIGGVGYGVERYKAKRDLERTFGKMDEEQKRKLMELQEMGKLSTNKDIAFFLAETIKDESLTPEQKRAEIEYAYNLAKQNAIDEVSNTDLEDTIEAENVAIDAVTNLATGEYIEVERWVLDGETGERVPQPGYIVGWIGEAPVFVPEGMENAEENRIVLKPNEWNPETVQRMPAEEVKALNEEMIREEAAAQAERESKYAPEVLSQEMQQGIPFETEDAIYVPISPMLEGNGWVVEVQPKGVDNKSAARPFTEELTNDQFHDLLQAQLDTQEAAQAEAAKVEESNQSIVEGLESKPMEDGTGRVMQPKGVQGNEVVYDITDGNGTVLEEGSMDAAEYNGVSEESKVSGQVSDSIGQGTDNIGQERTEAPVIPTKEDGSVDFVSYGKEGTFKALGEKYGEKMPNKVAVTAKALADDLAKAQKKLDKAIEDYDNAPIGREDKAEKARDKAQQELDAIKREADFWAEMDTEIKDAQFRRASMLNPQAETETSNEPMNADEFVAQQLAAGNIVLNNEDYKRETGYGDAEANAMNGGAAKIFGENGMTIQESGERLMEMDRENGTSFFDQTDSNAGRDALISLLGNVKSRKELNQYIANNRAKQAKKESEGLRNDLERSVMDANYASLEDYVLQMEASEMENPFSEVNADEILAIFAEAVEEYNNYLNPQENGQGTTEETIEGNGGLLSEEQSSDTGGTEVRQESARNGEGIAEESETADAATEVELTQQEGETPLQFAERAAEENRRRPLRKRAEEWSKALGVDVIFVEQLEDVDSQVAYFALMDGEKVSGWYEGMTGKVYFYMPNLDDISEVDKTYIHEVIAHKGLKEMLGKERFDELCDKVWDMMPSLEKAKFIRYPGVKGNTRAAADEYIAHLAEKEDLTPEEKTMWDRVVKAFRDIFETALNAIIGKVKLTDEDISNLIKASYANLKSGAEGGAVGRNDKRESGEDELVNSTRFRVVKDKNELVAVHNISEENLRKVLEVGGLIMPSIAITKADMGHEGYGEISLLFDKETINPTDRRNKVYGGDAWTPRFPQMVPKLNDKVSSKVYKKIKELIGDRVLSENYSLSAELHPDNIERTISDRGIEGYYGKEWMKLAYLLDNGKKIKVPMKMKDYGDMSETILEMAKERGLKVSDIQDGGFEFYQNNADFVAAVKKVVDERKLSSLPEEQRNEIRKLLGEKEMKFNYFDTLISAARRMEYDLEHGGLKKILDRAALRESIEKKVKTNNADYNKWVDNLFDGIVEKYGIRNDRDWYTPSGYLRPWGQLYDDATPANILKHMLAENEQGGSGGFFDSNIMGASAETYESIEEIREKGKKRLRRLEDGEYDEWSNSISERMSEICNDFLSPSQRKEFGAAIDAKIDITNAVAKDKSAKGIYKEMKREYPGFTMDHAKRTEEIVKEIQDFAIGYFEAKPRRIVPLSEVRKAIVPKKTSSDIVEGLKNNGIEVSTYKNGDEAARTRLIKKESNGIRFRISEKGKQIQVEVDKFTAKYNSKPVVLVDSEMTDEELEEAVPESSANRTREEISSGYPGGYSRDTDKIYIFVDNQELGDLGTTMFHENLHPMYNGSSMVEELYNNAKEDKKALIEALSEAYEGSEIPNEMFAHMIAKDMFRGDFKFAKKYLSEESRNELFNTLKEFGYDRVEEESIRRRQGNLRSDITLDKEPQTSEQVDGRLQEGKAVSPRERKERLGKLFDQVADMGLEGVLENKAYTSMMVDIYKVLPEAVRTEIADDAIRLYGGSVAPAVSDYIGVKSKESIIDKVVTIVREALRKVGFDLDLNANEVRYLAWRSKKPLDRNNLLEVAEDIDMKNRLKVGEYDGTTPDGGGTRFRASEDVLNQIKQARREVEKAPSEAQKEAGNYKKGHISLDGFEITLENPKGGTRSGVDKNGKKWSVTMNNDYGYIRGTEAVDGDHIDVFLSDNPTEGRVFVVDQSNEEGTFDESKVMYGFNSLDEARNAYLSNYEKGWEKRIMDITEVSKDEFKKWIDSSHKKTKAFSEYKSVKSENNDIRFRVGGKLNVRDEYEATIKKGGYQAREAVQDAMLSLRKFQELIEKATGKKIRDFENAWMHENRLSSVVQAEIHEMERNFYKPMMDAVKKLMDAANLEQEEVADYLMLKHGIERNREMAVRKALIDDNGKIDRTQLEQWYQEKQNIRNDASLDTWRKKQEAMDNLALMYGADMSRDYSGLTSMFGTDDLADSTQKAYDEVEALENAHPLETESLGKAIKAMTQSSLDKAFESGLMDRKVYNELTNDMYDYYIPLRGFDETTSEEVYAYLDQDRGAFNAPLVRAKGRSSKSDNPIAYLKSIAESGIMQGNRNKMKQSFLNMVMNNPSDLVSVREGVWAIFNPATGEWEAATPPTIPNNATPADVEAAMEAWEQQMEQAAQNDPTLVKKVAEAADVPYRVVGNRMNQHQVIVKRLGKSYTLTINGNPRLAMALNGQTNPNNTSNDGKVAAYVSGKIDALNRNLSAWYTTRNPDFVASNFMRDTFYTNTIVRAKEGNAYANKFHKNYAKLLKPGNMINLFRKYENGTLDVSNKTEAAFLDFMMNGGETGYSNLKDLEHIKKQIAKELKGNKLAKLEKVAEKLDILNRAVENTARFAAYLTSRQEGRSIAKSIFDAKEISVNFNKKGAGGTFFGMTGQAKLGNLGAMVGAGGRAFYVFFNAAIQGTTNLMHVMKVNPKGTSAGVAAMFLMGAVVPMLFAGDDDEKNYYDLPEHVRRNHLIIPGTGDAWVSIPLPIEYRIMYGMGELLTSWRTGHERGSDIARKMLNLTGQALPLNFLEEGFDAFIPSALSPIWQVYNNKSWTGLPIYKDTEFNKDDPEYTKAYKNVDRLLYNFSKSMYEWTFDEENQKARVDLNPAVMEALARGYFGGLATQLSNLGKTWETIAGEREFDWRSIPIGNRVFKSGDERTKEKRVTNEYFENMEKLEFLQARERLLKKTINGVEVPEMDKEKAKIDDEIMRGSEVYQKYMEFKKLKKTVDKIRKTIKEKGSTPELEKALSKAQEEANKAVR